MHLINIYKFFFVIASLLIIGACNSGNQSESKTPAKQTNVTESPLITDFAGTEKILEKDSLNTDLRSQLATSYYAAKNFEKAIFHFLKIYSADNKNLSAITNLGNLYYDTGKNEKAIEFYEKALKIDNTNIGVRCDMATCYMNIKNFDKAITILKENIQMNDKHIQSHHNLAIAYKQSGKQKEADEEMAIFEKLKQK